MRQLSRWGLRFQQTLYTRSKTGVGRASGGPRWWQLMKSKPLQIPCNYTNQQEKQTRVHKSSAFSGTKSAMDRKRNRVSTETFPRAGLERGGAWGFHHVKGGGKEIKLKSLLEKERRQEVWRQWMSLGGSARWPREGGAGWAGALEGSPGRRLLWERCPLEAGWRWGNKPGEGFKPCEAKETPKPKGHVTPPPSAHSHQSGKTHLEGSSGACHASEKCHVDPYWKLR